MLVRVAKGVWVLEGLRLGAGGGESLGGGQGAERARLKGSECWGGQGGCWVLGGGQGAGWVLGPGWGSGCCGAKGAWGGSGCWVRVRVRVGA